MGQAESHRLVSSWKPVPLRYMFFLPSSVPSFFPSFLPFLSFFFFFFCTAIKLYSPNSIGYSEFGLGDMLSLGFSELLWSVWECQRQLVKHSVDWVGCEKFQTCPAHNCSAQHSCFGQRKIIITIIKHHKVFCVWTSFPIVVRLGSHWNVVLGGSPLSFYFVQGSFEVRLSLSQARLLGRLLLDPHSFFLLKGSHVFQAGLQLSL